jgi:hypothetical protein
MNLNDLLLHSPILVKELTEGLNCEGLTLTDVETRILQFIHQIGQAIEEEVCSAIREPTIENRLKVNDKVAVFDGNRSLSFRNRFGGITHIQRRCYKYLSDPGGWYPVDEKLGLDKCLGYSPLMSYLLSSFGASEPFAHAAELLGEALGFPLSATAVQRNTEATGERIPDNPYQLIAAHKAQEKCELMVVEVDGTMSPQILEKDGVSGRESLKQPTEYKECNVVVIEKHNGDTMEDRWTGARYGKREEFEQYAGRAAIAMGQHSAKHIVFLADGSHSNWELQSTNFPGSVGILDFYHATEHLGTFCDLIKDERKSDAAFAHWRHMLSEGQALEVIQQMRAKADRISERDTAIKEINYFKNNLARMDYDSYRAKGYPIGSGLVEGSCKFVVGKRFKGSGMRWKKRDNIKVLRVRHEKLNGCLHDYFKPEPQNWVPMGIPA